MSLIQHQQPCEVVSLQNWQEIQKKNYKFENARIQFASAIHRNHYMKPETIKSSPNFDLNL